MDGAPRVSKIINASLMVWPRKVILKIQELVLSMKSSGWYELVDSAIMKLFCQKNGRSESLVPLLLCKRGWTLSLFVGELIYELET